ncbi:MAG: hypothetical protein IK018_01000 [Lachnospiraceae bacterium]|nr:hypothetical protein [Lachnospiraceae bacterium]
MKKGGHYEYYYCEAGVGSSRVSARYLSKNEDALIKALVQKEYDKKLLREASEQLKKMKRKPENVGAESLEHVYYDLTDARKQLINPRMNLRRETIQEWLDAPYEGKGFREGDPEIYTEAGERVRSKSEKMIADKLRLLEIPYKYECPMELKGYGTIYPDFTLLNKHTLQPAILEHFGIMDDPEYSANAVAKVRTYERNGIFLGQNLFLTFETAQTPFDARSLETILADFI